MLNRFLGVVLLAAASMLAAQQTLDDDGVIKMIKAGLSEDVIAAAISSSPGTYDTSANALIALKTAGAGDKIMAAILTKASGATTAATSAGPATSALPKGVDEVGGVVSK